MEDTGTKNEIEDVDKSPLETPEALKILRVYDCISIEPDITESLTALLSTVNTWGYSTTQAHVVNHRQGKQRLVYDSTKRELMKSSYEEDVDLTIDKQLDELFVYVLNEYLKTKTILPEKVNARKMMKATCAACLIMLFKNNQFGIIPRLTLPDYAVPWVEETYKLIDGRQEEVYYEWITYLSESGNDFLIDPVKELGFEFFGTSTNKAVNTFQKYFRKYYDKIVNFDETYAKYLEYRAEYFKVTGSINQNQMYEIFELTDSIYNKRKDTVINEFQQAFSEEMNASTLKRLIYGD